MGARSASAVWIVLRGIPNVRAQVIAARQLLYIKEPNEWHANRCALCDETNIIFIEGMKLKVRKTVRDGVLYLRVEKIVRRIHRRGFAITVRGRF
jgi:hypothetical protein